MKYRSFVYWLPIYCIGASISPEKLINGVLPLRNIEKRVVYYVSLLLLIAMAWLLPNSVNGNGYEGNLVFYLFRFYCIFSFIVIIDWIADFPMKKAPIYMNFSFWVYCVHFPLISLFQVLFKKVTIVHSPYFNIIEYCLTVSIVYLVAVMLAIFIKKLLPPVWRILNGGRN